VLDSGADIHFIRDLTRGGLASVLHELSEMTGYDIEINEGSIPVDEPVRGLCEVLGFDPLYLANEGKIIIVADENDSPKIISLLRSHVSGKNSSVIGDITDKKNGSIIIETSGGGRRILDLPSGIQLPRIC
jgi:hydrogenase expression/formation protein HypE